MSEIQIHYKPFGERSILIEWPQIISENVLKSVIAYRQNLENFNFKQKVYIKSAYNSILITYEFTINNLYDEILTLKSIIKDGFGTIKGNYKLWKIPVCYDLEFGIDLEQISSESSIEITKIIELHTSAKYLVYFIGFLPGFLYLGGLDNRLQFSRKITPILNVKKGSVAIGGSQTGIYPNDSPGGWNIIGNSPINFFDVNNQNPCFAQAGDKIKFIPISKKEYKQIAKSVESGNYTIESEVMDG